MTADDDSGESEGPARNRAGHPFGKWQRRAALQRLHDAPGDRGRIVRPGVCQAAGLAYLPEMPPQRDL